MERSRLLCSAILFMLVVVTSLVGCGPKPPTVATSGANEVTIDAAILGGSLDDIGSYSSVSVSFVWGPDSIIEPTTYPNETVPQSRTSIGDFNATVSDLLPDTTYYFQAKAIGNSSIVYGEESSFTTKAPPVVITEDATIVSESEVNLEGTLTDLGSASSVRVSFLLGTTSGGPYPDETPSETMNTTEDFTFTLGNLSAGTTYYYKAKAIGDSTEYGDERSLTTPVPVTFPDSNLETAIRKAIGKHGGVIYSSDLDSLNLLIADRSGISDLTGLEYCRNIEYLELGANQISDISPLSNLTKFDHLDLAENQISDLSPLASLTRLGTLIIHSNLIKDVSPLHSLTNLTYLDLNWNQISDISPLSNLNNLRSLYINSSYISDISPLAALTNLTILGLFNNQISDVSPLSSLTNLKELYLDSNLINDISFLESLTNLKTLFIIDNNIRDLSPLSGMTNLTFLAAQTNQISDISAFSNCTSLAELFFDSNQISDISPLSNLTKLSTLNLNNNWISDLSPLASLTNLTVLELHSNQITDISVLTGLTSLRTVLLWDNPLNDESIRNIIPTLLERQVAVNW